ncbi:hypothetical protein GCM10009760_33270 [Kitasatospora kazusensis]|uniref:Secreted protein n=1 Tax=Kitasatospora kazusensis TaxID=407974 RepID=A0ABP5LFI3_9ACTN
MLVVLVVLRVAYDNAVGPFGRNAVPAGLRLRERCSRASAGGREGEVSALAALGSRNHGDSHGAHLLLRSRPCDRAPI